MFKKGDRVVTVSREEFPVWVCATFEKYISQDGEYDCLLVLDHSDGRAMAFRSSDFWYMGGRHMLTEVKRGK